MRKLLAKLMNWEGPRKSNWTKAMEAQNLNEDERKKVVDKAREDLKNEPPTLEKGAKIPDKKEIKQAA